MAKAKPVAEAAPETPVEIPETAEAKAEGNPEATPENIEDPVVLVPVVPVVEPEPPEPRPDVEPRFAPSPSYVAQTFETQFGNIRQDN